MAAREEPETVAEPGRNPLDPEGGGARGGKLDCQRDAIKATTNSSDRGHDWWVRRKMWRGRACSLDEQSNSAVAKRVLAICAIFCWYSERRYRVNPFPFCAERLAASGDHSRCRICAQQRLSHPRRYVDHVLAIVEHEHELL